MRNYRFVDLYLEKAILKSSGCSYFTVLKLFQVQTLKVLVNLSSNPDLMDDIVQAQVN